MLEMIDSFQVEVKDPPQGILPPTKKDAKDQHRRNGGQHGGGNRNCGGGRAHRLRKFVAKPSAGLRVRVHPTLQSEQIAVLRVDGVVAIADELQNADGVWVRLAPDAMVKMGVAHHVEGWCLQYNNHLEKTLLVPVADGEEEAKEDRIGHAPYVNGTTSEEPAHTFPPEQPLLRSSRTERARRSVTRGPGVYTVIKCGASGHNLRSSPNMLAAPVGKLNHGDVVGVADVKEDGGEVWVMLDSESAEKFSFSFEREDENCGR